MQDRYPAVITLSPGSGIYTSARDHTCMPTEDTHSLLFKLNPAGTIIIGLSVLFRAATELTRTSMQLYIQHICSHLGQHSTQCTSSPHKTSRESPATFMQPQSSTKNAPDHPYFLSRQHLTALFKS